MKSKASLPLMELLIMVLVFALAAAICLQVFARAREISLQTARIDEAAVLGQNAAEQLKATQGDVERAMELACGSYDLRIQRLEPAIPGLGQAQICVYYEEQCLLCFETGWQEVAP